MKKYAPCEVCGSDIYTEQHHPHGKIRVMHYMDFKRRIHWVFEYDSKIEMALSGEHGYIEEVHQYPFATVTLCGNCHSLLTRGVYDLTGLIEAVRSVEPLNCGWGLLLLSSEYRGWPTLSDVDRSNLHKQIEKLKTFIYRGRQLGKHITSYGYKNVRYRFVFNETELRSGWPEQ